MSTKEGAVFGTLTLRFAMKPLELMNSAMGTSAS